MFHFWTYDSPITFNFSPLLLLTHCFSTTYSLTFTNIWPFQILTEFPIVNKYCCQDWILQSDSSHFNYHIITYLNIHWCVQLVRFVLFSGASNIHFCLYSRSPSRVDKGADFFQNAIVPKISLVPGNKMLWDGFLFY